jgi:hypothetical protein
VLHRACFARPPVRDAAREAAGEASGERGVRRPLAEQRGFVLGRCVRLLAGEKGGSNLGDLGPERERRANAGPVDDAARTPAPSTTPPAAITGAFTRRAQSGTSANVPMSDSSARARNETRWPPASKPVATMASTPASSRATASAIDVAAPTVTMPRSLQAPRIFANLLEAASRETAGPLAQGPLDERLRNAEAPHPLRNRRFTHRFQAPDQKA